MSHEELQLLIPDYLGAGLEEGERARLETHLAACSECAETIEIWRNLLPVLRSEGEALLEDHPSPSDLRRFARDGGDPEKQAALSGHVGVCPRCALEVEAWKSKTVNDIVGQTPDRRAGGRRRIVPWIIAAGAAAVLLIGIGLGRVIAPDADLSGPLTLIELPETLRKPQTVDVPWRDEGVVLAIPFEVPDDLARDDLVSFELADPDGRVVWSASVDGGRIERILTDGPMITLPIPTGSFAPGRYRFRISRSNTTAGRVELREDLLEIHRE